MGKYDPLHSFLQAAPPHLEELTLSFAQIEQILSKSLPASAFQHQAWWSNPSTSTQHPHAQSWLAAGWRVAGLNQQEAWVRFQRGK